MTAPEPDPRAAEVLGSEPPPRRRAVPLLLAVALVAVLAGLGGDALLRGREAEQLLERTAAATATARYAERRVLGVADYTSPALFGVGTPDAVRRDLRRLLGEEAAGQVPAVRARVATVAGTDVLPWHEDLSAARAAVVAHVRVRADALVRVSQDSRSLFEADPEVAASRARATEALLKVVSGPDAGARVRAALEGT